MKKKLQLWHAPQIQSKPFKIEVESPEEAAKIAKILAAYDQFQFQEKIKGDFCNYTDLVEWDEEENEFLSWYDEIENDFGDWSEENTDQKYWDMLFNLNNLNFDE